MNNAGLLIRRILANDLRLYLRAWQRRGARRFSGVFLQVVFIAWLHFAIYPVIARYGGPTPLPGGLEFACLFVALMLLMAALQRSLEVLYNRGDLPMLLASPVPMRAVVGSRLADIQITTWLSSGLVMLPLINVSAWLHGPQWLWAWLAWLFAGLTIVPTALLITVLAVRAFGPRRARIFVQIGSIVLGLSAVIGVQAPNWMDESRDPLAVVAAQARFFQHFDLPVLNQWAAATRGDPRWLTALVIAGATLGAFAFRLLVREFAQGAQSAAGDLGRSIRKPGDPTVSRAWHRAFRETRTRAIVRKDLRLVQRDPLLLVRASTQMVSLLPALALVLWDHTAAGVAAFALLGPPVVAVTLATMMTLNDEAHIFVASSPVSPARAARARTAAAAVWPIVLAVVLASGALVLGEPVIAFMGATLGGLNAVALAWVGTCSVRPLSAEERARNRYPRILGPYFFAMLVGGLGAGGISALVFDLGLVAVILLIAASSSAALAFLLRPKPWAEVSS